MRDTSAISARHERGKCETRARIHDTQYCFRLFTTPCCNHCVYNELHNVVKELNADEESDDASK